MASDSDKTETPSKYKPASPLMTFLCGFLIAALLFTTGIHDIRANPQPRKGAALEPVTEWADRLHEEFLAGVMR